MFNAFDQLIKALIEQRDILSYEQHNQPTLKNSKIAQSGSNMRRNVFKNL